MGWLLGKMVSPIHRKPRPITHVTGCCNRARSGASPESHRATNNKSKANNMGSVGMYHPMEVRPNSLRLTDNGTRKSTTDRYPSMRANAIQTTAKTRGSARTCGTSNHQPARAMAVMRMPPAQPACFVVQGDNSGVIYALGVCARCSVSQASMARNEAPTAMTAVITTMSHLTGLDFLSAAEA